MPNPGDGFTVISAMRHSQPAAMTMLLGGFPDVKSAMEAIILEADEIVVKPVEIQQLAEMVRERLLVHKPASRTSKERVSEILQRCSDVVVNNWLARAKQARQLNHLALPDGERTGHLPKLVEDLVSRLNKPWLLMSRVCARWLSLLPATDSHGHDRFGSFRLPFSYTKIETCSALTPSSRRLFPPLRLHPHPARGEGEYRRSGSDQRSQDQGILD
jgi:hypothetical protein